MTLWGLWCKDLKTRLADTLVFSLDILISTFVLLISGFLLLILILKFLIVFGREIETSTVFSGVVFQLAAFELVIVAVISFAAGIKSDVQRWKASWIASIIIFDIVYHSIKICVEIQRYQVAVTWRNRKRVCTFIVIYVLKFPIFLTFTSLSYTYLIRLDHMENVWKLVALGMKIITFVVGGLLAVGGALKLMYWMYRRQWRN